MPDPAWNIAAVYAGAAFFSRFMFPVDSIAHEAGCSFIKTADDGEGYGDYIPDEDYVEESDPGDTCITGMMGKENPIQSQLFYGRL